MTDAPSTTEVDSTRKTEAESIAALAATPVILGDVEGVELVVAPAGWTTTLHDLEDRLPRPRRPRGTTFAHDAASFVDAVQLRNTGSTVVYAARPNARLTAVLNDFELTGHASGWGDHRIDLALAATPEWEHWRLRDGKLGTQEAFSEHIEDGLAEMVTPSAAEMLEVAQTFHATTASTFKSGKRLASGEVQFRYEEQVEATAGRAGEIIVPTELQLRISPFYGSAAVEVRAWFRYRLTRDNLMLGYKLDRPHEIEYAAFLAVETSVRADLPPEIPVIAGIPAETPR